MRKLVVVDSLSVNPGDLSWQALEAIADCSFYPQTSAEEVVDRCREAELVLTNKVMFTAEVLDQLPNLKYIGVLATGYNVVDIVAACQRGIVVTNIPTYGTASVAQQTFAHLLNITNRVEEYANEVRQGKWTNCGSFCYWNAPTVELSTLTIGIIGYGHIGKAVARIALGFGMKVLVSSSQSPFLISSDVKLVTQEELLSTADVISLHCKLSDRTKHLIRKETLALMKPSAILLNMGRGELLNETDVAEALREGNLAAAGLDVLSQEPPALNNPLIQAPRCYLTPHNAWSSYKARTTLIEIAVHNVAQYLNADKIDNQIYS
ncbi:MAG: D-2-hydroxyacid dehydrogenase [Bacteroidaceae bacterium]